MSSVDLIRNCHTGMKRKRGEGQVNARVMLVWDKLSKHKNFFYPDM